MPETGKKFLDFLRKWRRNKKSVESSSSVFFVNKPTDSALPKVIAKHLIDEFDPDTEAARQWLTRFNAWEKELFVALDRVIDRRRDYYNFETSHHLQLEKYLKNHKRQPVNTDSLLSRSWFAQAVTASAFALILSIALTRMNPDLAQKIGDVPKKIVNPPVLTLAYLFGQQELLAEVGDSATLKTTKLSKQVKPDHNILASYIINNRDDLIIAGQAEASFIVPRERLDGRIAGAEESAPTPPSAELLAISQAAGNRPKFKSLANDFLMHLVEVQIKATDRVLEWLGK